MSDVFESEARTLRAIRLNEATSTVFRRIGLHCQREAKKNAPRSPTRKQINATLVRKKRTSRQTFPGGLEKSIEYDYSQEGIESQVSVFVPENSPAGKYAKRIHDEKGSSWHKRGVGTQAKGARADDKFIERAVKDNQEHYQTMLVNALDGAIRKGLR